MIYLQFCCFCVDLRLGTMIVAGCEILMDLAFGLLIALTGESGSPDLGVHLVWVLLLVHLASAVCLLYGTLKLRPGWMLFYIIATIVKILAMIILVISDIILHIWWPVLMSYGIMFVFSLYFWLVAYSFYAALGGCLFI